MAGEKAGAREAGVLVSSFLHLMISQLATRVISFLLNVLIDRRLNAAEIGLSAVQFPLITTTIFMISREGFRRGCIRSDLGDNPHQSAAARVVSVAWLSVPVGLLVTCATVGTILWWQQLPVADVRTQALLVLGVAAGVELLSEPLYILAQCLLLLRVRVVIETLATLGKSLVTYALLLQGIGKAGGLVFAYAQLTYALVLLVGYWGYFLSRARRRETTGASVPLLPSRPKGGPLLDPSLLRVCGAFSWQSVEKLALAEGEKFVLVLSGSQHNQGVYGIVEKLGSLVVRSVLQPFEESAFTMFSKAASSANKKDDDAQKPDVRGVERVLLLAIKGVSLLGLVFVAFGPPYSYTLLRLLYGRDKSDSEAPTALACYCLYVMVMALNGITESFLHATASERGLAWNNVALVVFSVCHVALSVALVQARGTTGLILANVCNMTLRITYSMVFILRYFKGSPTFSIRRAVPSIRVIGTFIAAALTAHWAEVTFLDHDRFYTSAATYIMVGGACFVGVLGAIYTAERSFFSEIASLRRGSSASIGDAATGVGVVDGDKKRT
ncbi:oligosaccharidyl-lipid flippase family [Klebsormidium nitens]|uniref:Protein RFT1 homolog n=1 Tax=Klebsormidium nitens TaxID=105231 RepID=A0A1Y1HW48_KLENI|nr:oligosaccharidyl-lipid flippase family [Klebsormidium nitens]|eukprot:GAQ80068.1 oligosaccharidyl-lipid flippase family [Klebsormidium nitens]